MDLEAFRSFYARCIVQRSGSKDLRLIEAFVKTPRERFVGPGPWQIFTSMGYISTPDDDPRVLYQDLVVGIAVDRGINNGQPTLHAECLAELAVAQGETIVHVGAGTGYYTAVLGYLVGESGCVIAYEIEADLAARAAENLADQSNIRVTSGSGTGVSLPHADVIYVNAAATHPLEVWLDSLKLGGRLLFPLTPEQGYGCMLLVTRIAKEAYAARGIMQVAFIPCIGAQDHTSSSALSAAFQHIPYQLIRSLRRSGSPDKTAWCAGVGWWLSTADPE